MRISAKSDYAVRAVLELALVAARTPGTPVNGDALAAAQGIPVKFLRNVIMLDLRRADLVVSSRGPEGGYVLARPAGEITVADVIRAVDGPLATVQGTRPQDVAHEGPAEVLGPLWVAVRASLRSVLEHVSFAHLVDGALPEAAARHLQDPAAWVNYDA